MYRLSKKDYQKKWVCVHSKWHLGKVCHHPLCGAHTRAPAAHHRHQFYNLKSKAHQPTTNMTCPWLQDGGILDAAAVQDGVILDAAAGQSTATLWATTTSNYYTLGKS
jgi:hypothetical protein